MPSGLTHLGRTRGGIPGLSVQAPREISSGNVSVSHASRDGNGIFLRVGPSFKCLQRRREDSCRSTSVQAPAHPGLRLPCS